MKLWKKFLKKLRKKEKKRKKKLQKVFLVSVLWLIIIVWSVWFYQSAWMNFEEFLFFIYSFLQDNILLWILVFITIYLLRPLLFIPATPFEFIAAIIYWFWSIWVIIISLTLSIILNYFIGRRSKKYIELGLQDSPLLSRFRKYMKWDTFLNILFLRLMPFPFDIGGFLCGVFRLKFFTYLLASLLWAIPSSVIVFTAGLAFHQEELTSFEGMLKNVDSRLLMYAGIWFVLLYILIFSLKKFVFSERD